MIQLPKFKGNDSVMDIYTFKTQFEICVEPNIQRKLLPDTLKLNYLSDPALTLVRKVTDIEEIWKRLIMSYGNSRVLLQNKLSAFEKLGSLNKVRGDEKLIHAIYELMNAMAELSELAAKYHLENNLYHRGGLEKVMYLMGGSRRRRFCLKNRDLDLDERDEWIKLGEFLQGELKGCQKCLGIQPSGSKMDNTWKSGDSDRNGEQKGSKTFNNNVDIKKEQAVCRQKDHCCQCLSPGAKRGHMNCQVKYSCRHQSHGRRKISRACM